MKKLITAAFFYIYQYPAKSCWIFRGSKLSVGFMPVMLSLFPDHHLKLFFKFTVSVCFDQFPKVIDLINKADS